MFFVSKAANLYPSHASKINSSTGDQVRNTIKRLQSTIARKTSEWIEYHNTTITLSLEMSQW